MSSTNCARLHAPLAGAHLHLLAVLVGAGQEEDLVAHQPPETRDDVGQDLLVGMAQVRRPVGVVDGGGEVERLHDERGSTASGGRPNVEGFDAGRRFAQHCPVRPATLRPPDTPNAPGACNPSPASSSPPCSCCSCFSSRPSVRAGLAAARDAAPPRGRRRGPAGAVRSRRSRSPSRPPATWDDAFQREPRRAARRHGHADSRGRPTAAGAGAGVRAQLGVSTTPFPDGSGLYGARRLRRARRRPASPPPMSGC